VGALAAQRGWAVRQLDWHRPTLEELFARIALDLEPGETAQARGGTGTRPSDASAGRSEGDAGAGGLPVREEAAAYHLNPFLQPGAERGPDA